MVIVTCFTANFLPGFFGGFLIVLEINDLHLSKKTLLKPLATMTLLVPTRTGSGHDGGRKEAILVASTPQHRALLVNCRPHISLVKASSSPEQSSDSWSSNTEPEDHWTEVWKLAARDGNWEIAEKLVAPVIFKWERNPELAARAFERFNQPLNLVTDSA